MTSPAPPNVAEDKVLAYRYQDRPDAADYAIGVVPYTARERIRLAT
jgi:hypothetical protein